MEEGFPGVLRLDGAAPLGQNGALIEGLGHFMDRHAAFGFAPDDRPLPRARPAVAGEQRQVGVQDSEAGELEQAKGDPEMVAGDDDQVGLKGGDLVEKRAIARGFRLEERESCAADKFQQRGLARPLIGLGDDAGDAEVPPQQPVERQGPQAVDTHEEDVHGALFTT